MAHSGRTSLRQCPACQAVMRPGNLLFTESPTGKPGQNPKRRCPECLHVARTREFAFYHAFDYRCRWCGATHFERAWEDLGDERIACPECQHAIPRDRVEKVGADLRV